MRRQFPLSPPPRPEPVVFHKKIFWSFVVADAASAIADAQTSWSWLQAHPTGVEHDSWLLGRRPGLARYYATFAVVDGGSAILSYKFLHSHGKPLRVVGWGLLALVGGNHLYGVSVNASE